MKEVNERKLVEEKLLEISRQIIKFQQAEAE
jgi:hypothetical protein